VNVINQILIPLEIFRVCFTVTAQVIVLPQYKASVSNGANKSLYTGRKISASLSYVTVRGEGKMEMASGE
jgi:hypothetical protein